MFNIYAYSTLFENSIDGCISHYFQIALMVFAIVLFVYWFIFADHKDYFYIKKENDKETNVIDYVSIIGSGVYLVALILLTIFQGCNLCNVLIIFSWIIFGVIVLCFSRLLLRYVLAEFACLCIRFGRFILSKFGINWSLNSDAKEVQDDIKVQSISKEETVKADSTNEEVKEEKVTEETKEEKETEETKEEKETEEVKVEPQEPKEQNKPKEKTKKEDKPAVELPVDLNEDVELERGLELKESIARTKAIVIDKIVTKKSCAKHEYDFNKDIRVVERPKNTEGYDGQVEAMPLADTHFYHQGKNEKCFTYIFETDGSVLFLIKATEDYYKELNSIHPLVSLSLFPRSKTPWYSVTIDDTWTEEQVYSMLDDLIALNNGEERHPMGL